MRILAVASFFIILLVALFMGRKVADEGALPPDLPLKPTTESVLCQINSVDISPAGKFFVLSNATSKKTAFVADAKQQILVSASCLKSGSPFLACATTLDSFEGFRLLRWVADESSVFAIKDGMELVKLDLNEPIRISDRVRINRDLAATIMAGGVTHEHDIKAESRELESSYRRALRDMKQYELPMQVPVSTAPGAALVENVETGEISLLTPTGREALAFFSPQFNLPTIVPPRHESTQYVVIDDGVRVESGSLPNLGRSEDQLLASSPSRDAASSALGGQSSVKLTRGVTGARALSWSVAGQQGEHRCHSPTSSVPEDTLMVQRLGIGSAMRPLTLVTVRQTSHKGIALFFGGGPGGLVLGHFSDHPVALKLLESGWDVYMVNYSGSLGEGPLLAGRVAREGPESLREDARQIQRYLAKAGLTDNLLVYGESFGAVPATELARLTGANLVLVAPYIRHRDPSEWLPRKGSSVSPVNVPAQKRFERSMLAIPPRKTEWDDYLKTLYSQPRVGKSLVVFGKYDSISMKSDMPSDALKTEVREVAWGHLGISAHPEALSIVFDWLRKRSH